jgi:hypothetical protein
VEAVALYAKTTITSRCLLHVGIANASFWPADLESCSKNANKSQKRWNSKKHPQP